MDNRKSFLRILILQHIEPVGARRENVFDSVSLELFDIRLHQLLEETGFAHPSNFIAAALFLIAKDPEVNPCAVKVVSQCLSDFLYTGVEGSGTTHKEKEFSSFTLRKILDPERIGKFLDPIRSLVPWFAPGVAVFIDTF